MQKKTSVYIGVTLIVLAVLAFAGNILSGMKGSDILRSGFHSWPLAVIGIGLLFCIPPFIFKDQKGSGGLFIPGLPILATGFLLFVASLTGNWSLWGVLWPIEVIAVAIGFIMAAIFLRVVWLLVPAGIIGIIGLALLFCSITGLWESWAILWTVVPFSVGLPLLLIGIFRRIDGVKLAGLILTGLSGLAFAAMSTFIGSGIWIFRIFGPAIILLLGLLMIFSALIKKKEPVAQ